MIARACPLCGQSGHRLIFAARDLNSRMSDDEFRVVRCRCGMAYLNPIPADPGRHYPDSYEAHRTLGDGTARRSGSRRFRSLEGLAPGAMLDVGCGSGYDLLALRDRGWSVAGVEMNPRAAENARAQGLDVRTGTLSDARFEADRFDLVTMFHVLEHLPDPVGVASEAARILEPGGRLLAQVPNLHGANAWFFREHWYELDVPRHVNFFTPGTLRTMLGKAGLRVVSIRWIESAADFRRSLSHRTGLRLKARPLRATLRAAFKFLNLFRTGEMLEVVARR